jgi:phosphatidylserine decarboxylase
MKHAGKARQAGVKLLVSTSLLVIAFLMGGVAAYLFGGQAIWAGVLVVVVWGVFALFGLNFFRDPEPRVPGEADVFVSPGHGKIDVIDEVEENEFIQGRCRRISMFLSVVDVHVQNAPVAGTVEWLKHCPGQFLNAMRMDCGLHNENVLIGIASSERAGEKVGMRLIAGYLARRIIPWVQIGEEVSRGDRVSLIQFGSRVDLYLPLDVKVAVRLGDRVKGGETIIARRS